MEPFRAAALDAAAVLFSAGLEGFFTRPKAVGRGWVGRTSVLGAIGDATLKLGFSGLGVLVRAAGTSERDGGALPDLRLPFKPTLDGILIIFLGVRPRAGVISTGDKLGLKGLLAESPPGPLLEPGLLRDAVLPRTGIVSTGGSIDLKELLPKS